MDYSEIHPKCMLLLKTFELFPDVCEPHMPLGCTRAHYSPRTHKWYGIDLGVCYSIGDADPNAHARRYLGKYWRKTTKYGMSKMRNRNPEDSYFYYLPDFYVSDEPPHLMTFPIFYDLRFKADSETLEIIFPSLAVQQIHSGFCYHYAHHSNPQLAIDIFNPKYAFQNIPFIINVNSSVWKALDSPTGVPSDDCKYQYNETHCIRSYPGEGKSFSMYKVRHFSETTPCIKLEVVDGTATGLITAFNNVLKYFFNLIFSIIKDILVDLESSYIFHYLVLSLINTVITKNIYIGILTFVLLILIF